MSVRPLLLRERRQLHPVERPHPSERTGLISCTSVSDQRRGRLFVALAAIAWSTAGLLQRELSVDIGSQLAGRALFAFLGVLAYVAATKRGQTLRAFREIGRGGIVVVAMLAVSSASFFVALNHASVANVLFMQAL